MAKPAVYPGKPVRREGFSAAQSRRGGMWLDANTNPEGKVIMAFKESLPGYCFGRG